MPGLVYPHSGHEVIGAIDAIGADIEGWQVGTRVGVGWHSGAWVTAAAVGTETRSRARTFRSDRHYARRGLCHAHAGARFSSGTRARGDGFRRIGRFAVRRITTFNALRHCGARPGDLVAVHGVADWAIWPFNLPPARVPYRGGQSRSRERAVGALAGAQDYIDAERSDPAGALQALGGATAIIATVTSAESMQGIVGGWV